LFDTAIGRGGEGLLPARAKPVQDTPTPSPNGVAGVTAARLHELTGAAQWRERAAALVEAFGASAGELGLHGAAYLLAADWVLHPATHLVVTGAAGDAEAERMHRRALATFAARRVVRRVTPADDRGTLPAAVAGMLDGGEAARGFLCSGATCSAPAIGDDAWAATIADLLAARRSGVDFASARG
jgi:uncharacterized protein YyaL (SSP411 family)